MKLNNEAVFVCFGVLFFSSDFEVDSFSCPENIRQQNSGIEQGTTKPNVFQTRDLCF